MRKSVLGKFRDALELTIVPGTRLVDLLRKLNEDHPHIVHFSGHGNIDEEIILESGEGDPAFPDNTKSPARDMGRLEPVHHASGACSPRPLSKSALVDVLKACNEENIRVVVLNACHTRPQAEALSEVIDCVISMNRAISDVGAIKFAASFYGALAFGRSVKNAFDQGLARLKAEGISETETPELMVRAGVDASTLVLVGQRGDVEANRRKVASTHESPVGSASTRRWLQTILAVVMFGLVALVVYIIVPPPPSRGVRENQATGDLRAARESQATRASSQSKLSKLEEQLEQAEIKDPHLIYVQDIDRIELRIREAGEPANSSMTAYIDSNTLGLLKDIEELTEGGLVASHAETYYRMGIYNQSHNNYDKAIKLYEKAIGLRPRWSKPIIGKALCLEALGNWDGALAAYRESDALSSDRLVYAHVLSNLAATFMVDEEYQRAAIVLERVNELDLNKNLYISLLRMLADAYRHIGNKPKEKSAWGKWRKR